MRELFQFDCADRDFVAKLELTAGADEVFVNGDSLIPNKSRMFEGTNV